MFRFKVPCWIISFFIVFPNLSYSLDPFTTAFKPLPELAEPSELERIRIALGKKLYLDPQLSLSKKISCNSCHKLDGFGVDNLPTSPGHEGKLGDRNSPTVYNSALHIAQFWDGRAKDVEEQALGPVLNPGEMAMPSEAEVMRRLSSSPEYKQLFSQAFPGEASPMNYPNVGKAIGAFERRLLTPSRFDNYLKGDDTALTQAEKDGLKTFVTSGCIACHSGVAVGGQMYQKLGLIKPYPTTDLGRYEVTKNEADKYFFKVPSLRNVTKTAPYFHDGSVLTLEDAILKMGEYQLGRTLSESEIKSIVAFLGSLEGTIPDIAK